jgi:hypothetical protein
MASKPWRGAIVDSTGSRTITEGYGGDRMHSPVLPASRRYSADGQVQMIIEEHPLSSRSSTRYTYRWSSMRILCWSHMGDQHKLVARLAVKPER